MKSGHLVLAVLLILVAGAAQALEPGDSFCFEQAGVEYKVSPELLRQIAKGESGLKPNVLNRNKNGSYDYGVMQVNSSWYYDLGPEFWRLATSSTCGNIYAGAYILSDCIKRYGYTWTAVGCYHSPKQSNARAYAWKVYRAWRQFAEIGEGEEYRYLRTFSAEQNPEKAIGLSAVNQVWIARKEDHPWKDLVFISSGMDNSATGKDAAVDTRLNDGSRR